MTLSEGGIESCVESMARDRAGYRWSRDWSWITPQKFEFHTTRLLYMRIDTLHGYGEACT